MRPIDADALMKELEELREAYRNDNDDDGYYATEDFECLVRNAPTIEVRPVVHGHWIRKWDTHCSACGVGFSEMPYSYDTEDGPGYVEKYCPNCGAIMDEKEEEE